MERLGHPVEAHIWPLLVEHLSEAVFTVDRNTLRIRTANARLLELIGRVTPGVVGCDVRDLLKAESDARLAAILGRAGLHEDVTLRRNDGYPLFVDLTVAHVDCGDGMDLAACVARDTTERRLLERELITKHAALYSAHAELARAVKALEERNRELAERNRELAVLGARLSEATRRALIGELSAGIAHSLNNPLGALVSTNRRLCRIIEEQGSPELRDKVARLCQRMTDAAARMEATVQAVKRAHRSGSTSSAPQVIDVAEEIDSALCLFESRMKGVEVAWTGDGQARAYAPPGDVQHVLWNLFDNALRAMNERGRIEIHVESLQPGARVVIADSGPGVPAEVLPRLFEPFVTHGNGSGLGLCTAQRLARRWGGDVRLLPSDGGAAFEIRIPGKEPACSANES